MSISCLETNFGPLHRQGDRLPYSIIITVVYLIGSKGHRVPCNEVRTQSLAKHIIKLQT